MSDHLLVERQGDIATLVLNKPKSHNAISIDMYRDLPGLVADLDGDPQVKVVVVRGAGQKAFASGADISEFEQERGNATAARNYNEHVAAAERALEGMAKPTIAMIHGYCIGGGAGLALACDLRFADPRARFAITPSKLGLVYSLESTKRVVDLAGPSRAKWILMSGQQIEAERALQLGLFDEIHPTEELESATYAFAEVITTRAQFAVRSGKAMVNRVVRGQVADDEETTGIRNSSFDTEDYAEGVRAFLEKRAPRFSWR
ncbi:enoyl-CoA hydratase-related protein [Geodermatophilus sp. YIM 151500]|uniref:enoyl-CoA hydratase-related protein n=1 Tax=Geodermatophilus sp. YIM 151500 TaxID=2984531 RepID=UPI0021E44913|nr:enoyl-CoA hydratase-related protein [Geodermatophilus sp. YIM 151500]MCV2491165.1 enoyl-CoA hydratase-related protein [Geodermatophilus sp. YIM 151500]